MVQAITQLPAQWPYLLCHQLSRWQCFNCLAGVSNCRRQLLPYCTVCLQALHPWVLSQQQQQGRQAAAGSPQAQQRV
jgi:hypothetical protein